MTNSQETLDFAIKHGEPRYQLWLISQKALTLIQMLNLFNSYTRRFGRLQSSKGHLYISQDQGYLKEGQFTDLYDKASMVKRLIFSFIEYLREHKKSTNSQNLEPRTSNLELS